MKVLQEIALADSNNVVMLWGDEMLSWSNIVNARHTLIMFVYLRNGKRDWPKLAQWDPIESYTLYEVALALDRFVTFVNSEHGTFATVLTAYLRTTSSAKLDVDHIYSLLSLASDKESCGIVPDYDLPANEVFRQAAECMLATSGADALTYCEWCCTVEHALGLPSWVPNFTSPFNWPLMIEEYSAKRERMFSAGGDPRNFSYVIEGVVLRLTVYRIGTLKHLAEFRTDYAPTKPSWQMAADWLGDFHSFMQTAGLPTSILADAWRVPVTDQTIGDMRRKRRASFGLKRGYDDLLGWSLGEPLSAEAVDYAQAWDAHGLRRRPFVTVNGVLGLGRWCVSAGDVLCCIPGADTLSILRPNGQEGVYWLIGEAFALGFMDGEAVTGDIEAEDISIV